MKYFSSQLLYRFCLLFTVALVYQLSLAQSCPSSSLTLNSVNVLGGGLFELDVRLCIGGGILGTTAGAGGSTDNFVFSFSGAGIVVSTFPINLTSDSTGCGISGTSTGPLPVINADEAIFYTTAACSYTCVSSTALCGHVHVDCKDYLFTVNMIPDSIRVYGIEGAGNPFAGCIFASNMLIDFTSTLDVEWGELSSQWQTDRLQLNWQTTREENNDFFVVERSFDLVSWEERGRVDSRGNSDRPQSYEFFDAPTQERVYYRVKQIDHDGQASYSSRIVVSPQESELSVFPNPTQDHLLIRGLPSESQRISLFNQFGQEVIREISKNENQHQLSLGHLPTGIYLLRVQHSKGLWQKRIIIE